MSKSVLLNSSLAKKYWMALTGLFLCLFLVGHLLGNLQLMASGLEARTAFNEYALFMTSFPLVKLLSYLTYFSILFHAIDGFLLARQNYKARPQKYVHNKPGANSNWASRNMALLGSVMLAFIIVHMGQFWFRMHFGDIPTQMIEGVEHKDLYTVVILFFQNESLGLVWTLVYAVCMVVIAVHLAHGFQSAFQSLGLRHPKYTPLIKKAGLAFAVLIPIGFAIIPLFIHFMMDPLHPSMVQDAIQSHP